MNLICACELVRDPGYKDSIQQLRDDESENASSQGQEQTFGQELLNDSAARRAQRSAEREFPATRGS